MWMIITLAGDVLSLLGAGFVLWAIVFGGWRPSRECLVCAGIRRGQVSAASLTELPTEAERRQVGGGG